MLEQITTALVLCAGLGTRMEELTKTCPKPLLPVWGISMLDIILEKLKKQGIKRLIVNTHYLPEMIRDHLKNWENAFEEILISHEKEILETGGGVRNALPLLGEEPFFVVNGDVIFDPDELDSVFQRLAEKWAALKKGGVSTEGLLAVMPLEKAWGYGGPGDFFRDSDGHLSFRGTRATAPYVYTGVQILSSRAIQNFKPGKFSAKVFWDAMLEKNTLYSFVWEGSWFHVGTKKAYGELPGGESL